MNTKDRYTVFCPYPDHRNYYDPNLSLEEATKVVASFEVAYANRKAVIHRTAKERSMK